MVCMKVCGKKSIFLLKAFGAGSTPAYGPLKLKKNAVELNTRNKNKMIQNKGKIIPGKSYLVTKDLVPTLERKQGRTLIDYTQKQVKILEEEFLKELWPSIPKGINCIALDALETSKQLERICTESGLPIVSLDRVYVTNADSYLEVTRQTDLKTGEIIIAARPGAKSIEQQIDSIPYKKIGLTDVGAFGGDTIIEVCRMLEKAGKKIAKIFLGYSSIGANEAINQNRDLEALNLFQFYEWIELRDLFGIDGRRIANGGFVPYWENLKEWASIPEKNEPKVKELCKRYNQKLFEIILEGKKK